MLRRQQRNLENQQLIRAFDKDPQSLTKEQLVRVSEIYHRKASVVVKEEREKEIRKARFMAALPLNRGAISGSLVFLAEARSFIKAYELLSRSALAMNVAGYHDHARRHYGNAADLAKRSANRLEAYAEKADDMQEKIKRNERIAEVLHDAAMFELHAGDMEGHDRLLERQRIVLKKNEVFLLEIAIKNLTFPINSARLKDLSHDLHQTRMELDELISGKRD